MKVTLIGAVKVERVSVSDSPTKAVKWKTSSPTVIVPVGTEVEAKKVVVSSLATWKVTSASVVLEKFGGTEIDKSETATVVVDTRDATAVETSSAEEPPSVRDISGAEAPETGTIAAWRQTDMRLR